MRWKTCSAALFLVLAFAGRADAACLKEAAPIGDASKAAVLCLTNEARTARGLVPFVSDPRLDAAAQAHADDMQAKGYFAHQGFFGPDLGTRMSAQGYAWQVAGENIAKGQRTPFEVVDAWLRSPTHCPQILGALNDIGIGVTAKAYWVQDFGVQQGAVANAAGGSCPSSMGRAPVGEPEPAVAQPPRILRVRRGRSALRVSVGCPLERDACTGTVRARRAGKVVARRTFRLPSGRGRVLVLRTRAGRVELVVAGRVLETRRL